MYKAKLINNKGEVTILQFVSVGPNNVASAVVAYVDGDIDCLPLHELRLEPAETKAKR